MTIAGKQRRLQRATRVLAGRVRALDAAPDLAALYRDLHERMVHALAEVKARGMSTKDEEPHWVTLHGVHVMIGPDGTIVKGPHGLMGKPAAHITHEHVKASKPTAAKAKTAKAGVHELLSSGHPFSKEELMTMAGVKTEKLFSDYMAMLKNPKYAGPDGALKIEKNKDGHYYVALPDGTPAPPAPAGTFEEVKKPTLPPHLQKLAEKMEAGKPSHTITEVKVPGYTDPEPPAEKKPTKAEKVAAQVQAPAPSPAPAAAPTAAEKALAAQPESPYVTALTALSGAHPGSMSKAVADKHYESAMAAANVYMAHGVKTGDVNKGHAAVLTWKKQKAAAMAAWAQAVHGHTTAPKPQQIYKADEQLATHIAQGMPMKEAIDLWKSNTAGEKMGTWPAKPGAPATPKAAATPKPDESTHTPVADMGHAAEVKPVGYDSLVPAHHEPIGHGDFASPAGAFHKGLSKIKGDLEKQSGVNAQDNKKSVEHKLRARLKESPNFQALVKRLGLAKEGHASLESRLIQQWAGSSGDGNPLSVALQLAVRDAFGIPDAHIEKKALTALNAHSNETELFKHAVHSINPNIKPLQSHEIETAKHALREFVQAQYHETQEMLKDLGHDHVYLARGMKIHTPHKNADGAANVKLQPASSFSTNYGTANSFAGHGTVFMVKVPREQVLSTYLTGFGCTGEHEVVVLAHNNLKAFTVPAGMTQTSASASVHEQVKAKVAAAPAPAAAPKPTAAPVSAPVKPPEGDHAAKLAALKKAVINAKSKAYKAGKVAFATKHPQKVAHATKAAQEAEAAVKALTEFKMGMKK